MLAANLPARILLPFAANAAGANIRTIPLNPTATPGQASLSLGFPPVTFNPLSGGGIPPAGQDFNGILNQVTAWNRWQAAGGPVVYDVTFSTSVGGYPSGAVLDSSAIAGLFWRSTVDSNTTDPDSSGATNWVQVGRINLGAATTFYISTASGSDSTGNGLTTGTAWKTLAHAISVFQQQYDFGGQYRVTVQLADGTYPDDCEMNGGIPGLTNPSNLVINGNAVTPANVIYTGTIAFDFFGAMGTVQNFRMAGNYGVQSSYGGTVIIGNGMDFGPMSGYQIYGNTRGNILIEGNYKVTGNAAAHISMLGGSISAMGGGLTITLSAGLTFGSFVIADGLSQVSGDITTHFSGPNPAGSSCTITGNSVVSVPGGATTYFPGTGNAISTGGQFTT